MAKTVQGASIWAKDHVFAEVINENAAELNDARKALATVIDNQKALTRRLAEAELIIDELRLQLAKKGATMAEHDCRDRICPDHPVVADMDPR